MPADSRYFKAAAVAALLGISERRLQQLAAEGFIPKAERGEYPLVASVQGYIRYLKELAQKTNRGSEHARLARAQATRVEMENYRRAGELIYRAQAGETINEIAAMLAQQLDAVGGRIANELAQRDAPYIRQRILDETRAVRANLAELLEKRADALGAMPDSGEHPAAAGEPESDEMG